MASKTETIEPFDELEIGEVAKTSKHIVEDDVKKFSDVTGDSNPLHLDEEYAEDTIFGGRIVHGVLLDGIISATLADLPGTVIYISKETEFLKPVYVNSAVTAISEIVDVGDENRFTIDSRLLNEDGEVVMKGTSRVQVE
jgi:acyl dehydratase